MPATRYVQYAPADAAWAEDYANHLDVVLSAISTALADPMASPPCYWALRYKEDLTEYGPEFALGSLQRDADLNIIVAYPWDGPFVFAGVELPKPPGDDAMRGPGVIVAAPNWYPFE